MIKSWSAYELRVRTIIMQLGIPNRLIVERGLILQAEAGDLLLVETDDTGRQQRMAPAAAKAWELMKSSAQADGVALKVASAFRSVDRQAEIIREKLGAGTPVKQILDVVAPPGYSEHHTGFAVDITTDGVKPVELEFETTTAFRWLTANGGKHGFVMSYPKGNKFGYQYEPWHWRWRR